MIVCGSGDGNGSAEQGEEVVLTATPAARYVCRWSLVSGRLERPEE